MPRSKGVQPGFQNVRFGTPYAEDGADLCYVKDAARAIALLHAADKLNHQLYNVASGRSTTNQEVVDAIKKVIPTFNVDLPVRRTPGGSEATLNWAFDITRLHEDTGYVPQFDIEAGTADYIAWLRAGNPR